MGPGLHRRVRTAVALLGVGVLAACSSGTASLGPSGTRQDPPSVRASTPGTATSAAPGTPSASPSGGDARAALAAAIKGVGTHGPHRITSTGNDPAHPDECLVVSAARFRGTVHGPDRSTLQFVKIDTRTWTKLGSDPWQAGDRVDGVGCSIPAAITLRTGTDQRAASGRQIAGTAALTGNAFSYTARLDRAGRLMSLEIRAGTGVLRFTVTYDASIAVRPPA